MQKNEQKKVVSIVYRIGIIFISLFCFIVLFFGIIPIGNPIFSYPLVHTENPKKADVIIVLGNGLKKDGSLGKVAEGRVVQGVALWKQGLAPVMLMTGGPVHGDMQRVESKAMAAYAQTLGVPADKILTETNSTSTRENAEFSKLIMEVNGLHTADIVTSRFHSRRSCQVFHREQIEVTCTTVPNDQSSLNIGDRLNLFLSIIREYAATEYYSLKGYL